jgi:hypothetical protein
MNIRIMSGTWYGRRRFHRGNLSGRSRVEATGNATVIPWKTRERPGMGFGSCLVETGKDAGCRDGKRAVPSGAESGTDHGVAFRPGGRQVVLAP